MGKTLGYAIYKEGQNDYDPVHDYYPVTECPERLDCRIIEERISLQDIVNRMSKMSQNIDDPYTYSEYIVLCWVLIDSRRYLPDKPACEIYFSIDYS
jgi:hypothetical protein